MKLSHKTFLTLDKHKAHVDMYYEIKTLHSRLKHKLETLSEQCKTLSGKELGLKLKNNKTLVGLMFAIQRGQITSIDDYLYEVDIRKYEELLRI